MSGARPKKGFGPEPPSRKKEPVRTPAPDETSGESPPALTNRPFLEGRAPKLLMLAATIVVGIMFILAFSFCLAGGIRHKQPRYFLLLTNITLSTSVTMLLIFLYYRRVLTPVLIWYVFLQCLFLFFQCVTTDIFAWYEAPVTASRTEPATPTATPTVTTPWSNLTNASRNHTPNSSVALGQWPISS